MATDLSQIGAAGSTKVVGSAADGTEQSPIAAKNDALKVAIQGNDGTQCADVELIDTKRRLLTEANVKVESLFGFDPIADVWFYVGLPGDTTGPGAAGDTITVNIAAGDDPAVYPAISVVITLAAPDVVDEDATTAKCVATLNADVGFKTYYFAQRIRNAGVVHISAKQPGEFGERRNTGDFSVSATGTTVVTAAFDKIIRRSKITSLARDPSDPRQGILGITGSVVQSEGEVTGRFFEFPSNAGSSSLLVNGSLGTPIAFRVEADAVDPKFISQIKIYGGGNGIKFAQFLSRATLTNGVLIKIRSNEQEVIFPVIKTTEDFKNKFASTPDNFRLDIQAGGDQFIAVLDLAVPFELAPVGTYASGDDYIEIQIRDNITSGIGSLESLVVGFKRDF